MCCSLSDKLKYALVVQSRTGISKILSVWVRFPPRAFKGFIVATFLIYDLITDKQLQKSKTECIDGVTDWFSKNPKRRICNVSWVYGKQIKVRKNHIVEDIEKAAKETKTKE